MDRGISAFVNETLLSTPKPNACSTVDRKSHIKKKTELLDPNMYNSLMDEKSLSSVSMELQHQRSLASSSLQRANKVAAIPSKYLRCNITNSDSNVVVSNESTVSESDLLKTPINTSTPRNSVERLSLGQSLSQLSYKLSNTNITLDKFVTDFKKTMKSTEYEASSVMFTPAEEAESMLLADELSWRKKNDFPVQNEQFSQVNNSFGKVSMGEFFQKRSDTLSDFSAAKSPVKKNKPVALINESKSFSEEYESAIKDLEQKSLSISAIQRFIAESEDTPRRAADKLLELGKKSDVNSMQPMKRDKFSLPVSKNSSYTSSHSDNEAINCITEKENVDTLNINQNVKGSESFSPSSSASRSSSRASSALSSLQNGKLPVETTKCDMVWGCVKLGKSDTQDFLIRNRSSKRLGLKLSLSGQEFKIRKDNRLDSEPLSSITILLHPHESKAIIVSYIPTKIGAATDELLFTPLDPNLQQTKKQCIRLYGYGGNGKIDFHNLNRDTTGKFWLTLGKVDNQGTIKRTFIVRSSGVLPTFVHVSFTPKDFAVVSVVPDFFVLIPGEQKEVVVSYIPSTEDHKHLQKSLADMMIVELGRLLVTSGTEVDRGRLRQLSRKYGENGLSTSPLATFLIKQIKGEVMPPDLAKFKERAEYWKELFKLFSRHEVIITVERDPDQTIIPQFPDESGLYQSLQDSSHSVIEHTTVRPSCHLEPSTIFLIIPSKVKDCLFFISESDRKLNFHVSSHPAGLEIEPKEDEILPGEEIVISLVYSGPVVKEKKQFKVSIYVENEVYVADVNVAIISKNKLKS